MHRTIKKEIPGLKFIRKKNEEAALRPHTKDHLKAQKKGFSLIESLLSLAILLFIALSSLEFFSLARDHFILLREEQERNSAVFSALDKMRQDLLDSGLNLLLPIQMGILEGIKQQGDSLVILSGEENHSSFEPLVPGQTRIQLDKTLDIKKGQELCIYDLKKGEVHAISSVDQDSVVLSSPMNDSYTPENTSIIILRKISLFIDMNQSILRRKVNASTAQPLLEEVSSCSFEFREADNLVCIHLSLKIKKKERSYETSVFPKNTALASSQ